MNSLASRTPLFRKAASYVAFITVVLFSPLYAIAQTVEFPAVGVWNGFLAHVNVVECNSLIQNDVKYRLVLRANSSAQLASSTFDLPGRGSLNIILNDLSDVRDQIGTYTIEPEPGQPSENDQITCRTVFYRPALLGAPKDIEYAFAIPVRDPLLGTTSGLFDSFNPEQSAQPVFNWLTVMNQGTSNFSASVEVYDGTVGQHNPQRSFRVEGIAPGARVDLAMGHEQGHVVGVYRIVPDNASAPYGAFLSRYSLVGQDLFNFAFSFLAIEGSCDPGAIPISTFDPATNWGEIGNASSRPVEVIIEARNQASNLIYTEELTLPPFSQHHILMNPHLGVPAVGSLRVRCKNLNDDANLLVHSLFYGHLASNTLLVEWSYASQARGFVVNEFRRAVSSVNTFLGAANWNKVLDFSLIPTTVLIDVNAASGQAITQSTRGLTPGGTIDLGLHEIVGPDFVGLAQTTPQTPSALFSSELIRVLPHASGKIGYILNIPSTILLADGESNNSLTFVDANGGSINGPAGSRVDFPPNALGRRTGFEVGPTNMPGTNLPANIIPASDPILIRPQVDPSLMLNRPATINIPLTSIAAQADPRSVSVFRWDGDTWTDIGGEVQGDSVAARTRLFSVFVLGVGASLHKPIEFFNPSSTSVIVSVRQFALARPDLDAPVGPVSVAAFAFGSPGLNNNARMVLPQGSYSTCIHWDTGQVDEQQRVIYAFKFLGELPNNPHYSLSLNSNDLVPEVKTVQPGTPNGSGPLAEGQCPLSENLGDPPPPPGGGGVTLGNPEITLTWNNKHDLDLWSISPSGEAVGWSNRTGADGARLDTDDRCSSITSGGGPEHIFWPGISSLESGTYETYVNFWSVCPPILVSEQSIPHLRLVFGPTVAFFPGLSVPDLLMSDDEWCKIFDFNKDTGVINICGIDFDDCCSFDNPRF